MHEPSPEAIRGGCPCGLWSPRNCAYTKAVGLCNPARNRAPGRPPRRDDEVRAEPAARPAVADLMADPGAAITEGVTEARLREAVAQWFFDHFSTVSDPESQQEDRQQSLRDADAVLALPEMRALLDAAAKVQRVENLRRLRAALGGEG